MDDFVQECIRRYKTVRPDWTYPQKVVLKLAEKHGFKQIRICGFTPAEYRKKEHWLDEEFHPALDKVVIEFIDKTRQGWTIRFDWKDIGKIILRSARRKRS